MILNKIITYKKKEVKKKKKELPLTKIKSNLKESNRDFKLSISKGFNLIAEIKKGSPSEGIINRDFNLERISRIYNNNKYVKAISVLTDKKFFFMHSSFLSIVRTLTSKPILRKDFIIDEYQVYETRYLGGDAVLLIARLLSIGEMNRFISIARRYSMDCLVEVHSLEELEKVLKTKAQIIGINNRNLDTLKIDLGITNRLLDYIPEGKIVIAESGYNTSKDISRIRDKVNGVLIGTSFLKSKDINKKINSIMQYKR